MYIYFKIKRTSPSGRVTISASRDGGPGIDRNEVDRLLYQQTLLEWLTDCFPSYIRDCKDQAVDCLYAAFHLALRGDGRFLNLADPWNGQLVGQKKPQDYFEFMT